MCFDGWYLQRSLIAFYSQMSPLSSGSLFFSEWPRYCSFCGEISEALSSEYKGKSCSGGGLCGVWPTSLMWQLLEAVIRGAKKRRCPLRWPVPKHQWTAANAVYLVEQCTRFAYKCRSQRRFALFKDWPVTTSSWLLVWRPLSADNRPKTERISVPQFFLFCKPVRTQQGTAAQSYNDFAWITALLWQCSADHSLCGRQTTQSDILPRLSPLVQWTHHTKGYQQV